MKKILLVLTAIVALMSPCVAKSHVTLHSKKAEKRNVADIIVTKKKIEADDSKYQLVEPYHTELPVLVEDTIVETSGSSLMIRYNEKGKREYVLSLSADENYVIPSKQLASFYQRHSPEAYTLHKKGKVLCNTAWGMLGGSIALYAGGIAMIVLGKNPPLGDYEQAKGPYLPHYEPTYVRDDVMCGFGAIAILAGLGCDLASCPLFIKGAQKRVEALDVYHIQAQQSTPKLSLNTQISTNGIGIALQF